jgi:WD40 repeat protein
LLASGGDDGFIFLWKLEGEGQLRPSQTFGDEDDDSSLNKETWNIVATLRGSSSEIYDLSWSPDSQFVLFGSVDNTACVWDVIRGKQVQEFRDHTHYVQGVTWDPLSRYLVTQSSDRSCRIYKKPNKKKKNHFICHKVIKKRVLKHEMTLVTDEQNQTIEKDCLKHKMFLDENVKSYPFQPLPFSH